MRAKGKDGNITCLSNLQILSMHNYNQITEQIIFFPNSGTRVETGYQIAHPTPGTLGEAKKQSMPLSKLVIRDMGLEIASFYNLHTSL